jgi:cell division protein FtsI/penicillin-binding protein 2
MSSVPKLATLGVLVGGLVAVASLAACKSSSRNEEAFAAACAETDGPCPPEAPPSVAMRAAQPVVPAVPPPPPVDLSKMDLVHLAIGDDRVDARVDGKLTAHTTLSPTLQTSARQILAAAHIPEGVVVLLDVKTGHVLAYASHLETGPARDLAVEATAPAASVFKVVTSTALLEHAGLTPETHQCYSGGEQRIDPINLEDDPARDRWCASLATALGRSLNVVFARRALHDLKREDLASTARAYGFNEPVPFDVPVQPSKLEIPDDSLGYARTAAGFWNSTLSPLEAAWMSATVARHGEAVRPSIVASVDDATGKTIWTAPEPSVVRRVSRESVEDGVAEMMEHTVNEGTSFRAFHDPKGEPFLGNVTVAGKTGTLTDAEKQRYYTWFTGFAPSRPLPGVAQVAVAVLVVNQATWHVKANGIARDVLRAYFAEAGVPNVHRARLHETATAKRHSPR